MKTYHEVCLEVGYDEGGFVGTIHVIVDEGLNAEELGVRVRDTLTSLLEAAEDCVASHGYKISALDEWVWSSVSGKFTIPATSGSADNPTKIYLNGKTYRLVED